GIAVSPIWVIMLSSVEENKRGKQMGYVYFAWLSGLLVGWAFMNVLVKLHPTRFAFMMSLVVIVAWVMYYFVNIQLTNYNTKPVKEQIGQIINVMKRHLVLFPGILLQGAAVSALVPILPT
ncbi:MFS transporter, partial [Staphylococcus epidermidis]